MKQLIVPVYVFVFFISHSALAGDVKIIEADFHQTSTNKWSVNVMLEHEDTGWNHYADNW